MAFLYDLDRSCYFKARAFGGRGAGFQSTIVLLKRAALLFLFLLAVAFCFLYIISCPISLNAADILYVLDYAPPSCHTICVHKAYFLNYSSGITLVPLEDSARDFRASLGGVLWDEHCS